MQTLYNIFFLLFFILSAPYYFLRLRRRGNWQAGFWQRFGQYDARIKQAITNRHVLWLHAVSVGEMNVCVELIRALEPRVPNVKIMVSTTTTTGMGELQKRLPVHVGRVYYPVDRRKWVNRALGTLHPEAIVLIEAEIWPNFIWRASARGLPLFLVNARLSDRSYPRYLRFGFIFRGLFRRFTGVGAQNESDAAKLRQLGCRPEAVHVMGNLKFDSVNVSAAKAVDVPALLERMGVSREAPLLVAGSTHDGEERLLSEIFLRLRKRYPDLFLILVPRHFERARDIGRQLEQIDLPFVYRTALASSSVPPNRPPACLLVDTTGELMSFYQHASLVYVGKSLVARGGQNPIEPAALQKATVFGPNMQNFADVVRLFLAADGAVQVRDAEELEKVLMDLLGNPARREQLGKNALKVVEQNRGAVQRTVELIVRHLEERELYVVPRKG